MSCSLSAIEAETEAENEYSRRASSNERMEDAVMMIHVIEG